MRTSNPTFLAQDIEAQFGFENILVATSSLVSKIGMACSDQSLNKQIETPTFKIKTGTNFSSDLDVDINYQLVDDSDMDPLEFLGKGTPSRGSSDSLFSTISCNLILD